jgi:phosphoribosylanthranilate isomerase
VAVNAALPDYAGFVFAPSTRQVTPDEAARLRAQLDGRIVPVGVFVEEKVERIAALHARGLFEVAQLHGSYRQEQIDELKRLCGAQMGTQVEAQVGTQSGTQVSAQSGTQVGIIRAVAVDEGFAPDLLRIDSGVDYLLFDYRQPGSGRRFDWRLLEGVRRPYFLAGGITLDNLDEALALAPFAVDVSSGVESNGVKDPRKIQDFTERVRRARMTEGERGTGCYSHPILSFRAERSEVEESLAAEQPTCPVEC